MRARLLAGFGAVFVAAARSAAACTLWGAVSTNGAGGTLISKNRDWTPDHTQELRLTRPASGYAHFGLYAVGGAEPGIKAGVNEKGLSVVTASASSIPKSKRDNQPGKRGVISRLLVGYATCDEVLADREAIFSRARVMFVLIADRTRLLSVEVGLEGRYVIKAVERGFVAHTNHYLAPELLALNEKTGASSPSRLTRISELMGAAPMPSTLAAFAAISRDRSGGPDNSLWRTGKGSRTLASWIVETPAQGASALRVVLANPGQAEQTRAYVLDEAFWRPPQLK